MKQHQLSWQKQFKLYDVLKVVYSKFMEFKLRTCEGLWNLNYAFKYYDIIMDFKMTHSTMRSY